MKRFLKSSLEHLGINLSLTKNLWYLEPYKLMQRFVTNPNPVIFDIGACDGYTSKVFNGLFPGSRIYAFEPFPDSFALLKATADSIKNVSAHQYALSNHVGHTSFFVNKSKATNSLLPAKNTNSFIDDHVVFENKISVETTTLDNFVEEHHINVIDILKLDVQGGELMVLEGAKNLLSQHRAKIIYSEIWFIEGYKGQPLYHDIATYLHQFGYLPFGVYHIHYREDGHQLWGDALFYLPNHESEQ